MQYVMMSGQVPDQQSPQQMMTSPGAGNMMFMPGNQMPGAQQSQMFPQGPGGMQPQGGSPQQMGGKPGGGMMPMQGQGQQGPQVEEHHAQPRGARNAPLSRAQQPKQGGGGWQANRPMGNAMAGGPGPAGYAPPGGPQQPQMAVPPGQQPHMGHPSMQPGHQLPGMLPPGAAGMGGMSSPKESDNKGKDRIKHPQNPWADIEDNPYGAYDKDMQMMWGNDAARHMQEKGGAKGNGKDSKQQRGGKGAAKGGCKGGDFWQMKEHDKGNAGADGHYMMSLGNKGGVMGGSPGMDQMAFHVQPDADNPFGACGKGMQMQMMWANDVGRQVQEKGGQKGHGKDSKQQRGPKGAAKGGCKGADWWQPKELDRNNVGNDAHYMVGNKGGGMAMGGMEQAAFHPQPDADQSFGAYGEKGMQVMFSNDMARQVQDKGGSKGGGKDGKQQRVGKGAGKGGCKGGDRWQHKDQEKGNSGVDGHYEAASFGNKFGGCMGGSPGIDQAAFHQAQPGAYFRQPQPPPPAISSIGADVDGGKKKKAGGKKDKQMEDWLSARMTSGSGGQAPAVASGARSAPAARGKGHNSGMQAPAGPALNGSPSGLRSPLMENWMQPAGPMQGMGGMGHDPLAGGAPDRFVRSPAEDAAAMRQQMLPGGFMAMNTGSVGPSPNGALIGSGQRPMMMADHGDLMAFQQAPDFSGMDGPGSNAAPRRLR
eukprot:TRINITY_DN1103_c0_g1_i1.p1 TRINITY_DN1103_c0_g1~~TRINITY_DN1103_c0_g1_i1.p1  ORF type:complete len:746 (+),score=179.59 TRINITY_DN1103_c0_g1_i1:127-2238(+)